MLKLRRENVSPDHFQVYSGEVRAVDRVPRSYRVDRQMAIDSARYLTTKNPGAEVTVRDLTTGEVTVIKHPNQK